MKILIISGYFPPYNAIGSIRVGELSRYLLNYGYDIKVLTCHHYDLNKDLDLPIRNKDIIQNNWLILFCIKIN